MTPARRKMLALLADGQSQTRGHLFRVCGSRNSGYRVLEALVDAGLLARSNDWETYWITPAGRDALGNS